MACQPVAQCIQYWPIDKLVFYARNPRKNDSAVDRMCSSIREFFGRCRRRAPKKLCFLLAEGRTVGL